MIENVIDQLRGTSNDLQETLDHHGLSENDVIGMQIFKCNWCDWWCDIDEMSDVEQVCKECHHA